MAERLCRKGLHPWALVHANGRRNCLECYRLREGPGRQVGRWSEPAPDPELAARYARWAAGLRAAIDTIRREQGFDGNERVWRTLGDVPGMQAPTRLARPWPPSHERRAS